jgi:hypothetical protein
VSVVGRVIEEGEDYEVHGWSAFLVCILLPVWLLLIVCFYGWDFGTGIIKRLQER